MPWLRSDNTPFPETLQGLRSNARQTLGTEFYRSRNPLDNSVLIDVLTQFQMPHVPQAERNRRNRIETTSMLRTADADSVYAAVEYKLDDAQMHYPNSRLFTIVNTTTNQGVVEQVVNNLQTAGWELKDFATALTCTPYHKVVVLTEVNRYSNDAAIKHTVIFTNTLDDNFMCKVGGIMPTIHGYTDVPGELVTALLNGDRAQYITALTTAFAEVIAERQREVEAALVREAERKRNRIIQNINGLDTFLSRGILDTLTTAVAQYEREISDTNSRLSQLYSTLKEHQIRIASTYWTDANTTTNEFVNYIKEHELDHITDMVFSTNNNSIDVQLVTKLLYWDEDVFQNYISSHRGNCVSSCNPHTRMLLANIFIDRTVSVTFHTAFKIRFNNGNVERAQGFQPTTALGIPHTHIYHHNCWGNNLPLITKAINKRDYIVMWEQIKAALSGLNLTDSVVFEKFCYSYMENDASSTKCLTIVETGEQLSTAEFKQKYPRGYGATAMAEEVEEVPTVDTIADLLF